METSRTNPFFAEWSVFERFQKDFNNPVCELEVSLTVLEIAQVSHWWSVILYAHTTSGGTITRESYTTTIKYDTAI